MEGVDYLSDERKKALFDVESMKVAWVVADIIRTMLGPRSIIEKRMLGCEFVFDNCFVPEENVLGEEGKGVYVMMSGLDLERIVLAAGPISIMQSCLDVVLPYDHAGVILVAAEIATQVALQAIQCLGGNGYVNEYPTGRFLRDAKLYEIGAVRAEALISLCHDSTDDQTTAPLSHRPPLPATATPSTAPHDCRSPALLSADFSRLPSPAVPLSR
ncbi:hypothetical protein L6452_14053 [Arctium lappa]|uniref:Uncharacterized protein n=1 Tax=Arctium lappa TaxID=4217 RepID=A0ACB9CJX6_ARCLA|nr:hypothetical protein L6452_14053 [Arctium lappa]